MRLLLILLFICSSAMAITAKDAAWLLDAQSSFPQAIQKAQKEHKEMVLLVVVQDGCDWCEKMVHHTFKNQKIKEALSDIVVAVVDLNTSLPKGMHAKLTPTMFFIEAKTGKVLQKNVGYESPGGFLIDIVSAKEKLP